MLRGMAGGTSVDLLWDAKARLGEAPVWDAARGCVWWIDCIARMLHRIDLATGAAASAPVAGPIHAIGLGNADVRNGGGLVAAMGFGFCALEPETGRHSLLSHPEEARPDFHFNDGKCGPDGRFWVGSTPRNYKDRGGRLFRLGPGAVAATMAEGFTVPNGPGWSPDGTLFYIADSPAGAIFRYGFDSDAGTPNGDVLGQREVAVEPGIAPGWPDGMAVDESGCLWSALGRRLRRPLHAGRGGRPDRRHAGQPPDKLRLRRPGPRHSGDHVGHCRDGLSSAFQRAAGRRPVRAQPRRQRRAGRDVRRVGPGPSIRGFAATQGEEKFEQYTTIQRPSSRVAPD